jgi:hypothetical protein
VWRCRTLQFGRRTTWKGKKNDILSVFLVSTFSFQTLLIAARIILENSEFLGTSLFWRRRCKDCVFFLSRRSTHDDALDQWGARFETRRAKEHDVIIAPSRRDHEADLSLGTLGCTQVEKDRVHHRVATGQSHRAIV